MAAGRGHEQSMGMYLNMQPMMGGYGGRPDIPYDLSERTPQDILRAREILIHYTFRIGGSLLPQIGSVTALSTLIGVLHKFNASVDGDETTGLINYMLRSQQEAQVQNDNLVTEPEMERVSHGFHERQGVALPLTRELLDEDFWPNAVENAVITGIGLMHLMTFEGSRLTRANAAIEDVAGDIADLTGTVADMQRLRGNGTELTIDDLNVLKVFLGNIHARSSVPEDDRTGTESMLSLLDEVLEGTDRLVKGAAALAAGTPEQIKDPIARRILEELQERDNVALVTLSHHKEDEAAIAGQNARNLRGIRANATLAVLKPALVEYLFQQRFSYEPHYAPGVATSPRERYRRAFYTAVVDLVLYPNPVNEAA